MQNTHHPVCHDVGWYCNETTQEIRFDIRIYESFGVYIQLSLGRRCKYLLRVPLNTRATGRDAEAHIRESEHRIKVNYNNRRSSDKNIIV